MSARSEERLWGRGRHQEWRATGLVYAIRRQSTTSVVLIDNVDKMIALLFIPDASFATAS
jgi:hypothetical protein